MNIVIFLSALLLTTSIADSHHEACGGMLFKTSLADQKQMVGDIIQSINAPGFFQDKQIQVKKVVEKFVAKDVQYIWNYKSGKQWTLTASCRRVVAVASTAASAKAVKHC